jgi:hypothetical protein
MKQNTQKRVIIQAAVEILEVTPWCGGTRPHHLSPEADVAVLLDDGRWLIVLAKDVNWKHYTQQQAPGWRNVVAYGAAMLCVAGAVA